MFYFKFLDASAFKGIESPTEWIQLLGQNVFKKSPFRLTPQDFPIYRLVASLLGHISKHRESRGLKISCREREMKPEGKRNTVGRRTKEGNDFGFAGRRTKEGDVFDMSSIKLAINEAETTKTGVNTSVVEKYMKRKGKPSADLIRLIRERRALIEEYENLVLHLKAKGMYVPLQ